MTGSNVRLIQNHCQASSMSGGALIFLPLFPARANMHPSLAFRFLLLPLECSTRTKATSTINSSILSFLCALNRPLHYTLCDPGPVSMKPALLECPQLRSNDANIRVCLRFNLVSNWLSPSHASGRNAHSPAEMEDQDSRAA